jgi:hypothetical protein
VQRIKNVLILLPLLLLFLPAAAQDSSQKLPLIDILKDIESKFNVSFTFADDNIKNRELFFPAGMDLDESIRYLNNHLPLSFVQLDTRYYAVRLDKDKKWSICGYLRDKESNESVLAVILVQTESETTGLYTSNDSGYFEAQVGEGSRLIIESLGYYSMMVPVSKFTACLTLDLEPKALEMKEVVISQYITQGINRMENGSFSIQTNELGILPGLIEQDVLQTIQALPGIQSIDEKVADINIRGGTNDQNLILWDGIRMYQTGHFFGLISAFNPYLTEEINLIKNGTPARYTNGISGTLDIRSNDRVDQEFHGGAGINLINADLYLNIPIGKKVSVQVSGRRSIADLFETPTYKQYFDRAFSNTEVTSVLDNSNIEEVDTRNEEFLFRDLSLKLNYKPGKSDHLSLNFLQIENQISFEENAEINGNLESRTSSLDQNNLAFGGSYSRKFGSRFKLKGSGYYSSYELKAINFDVINNQRLIQENEVIDTGLELDGVWIMNKQLILNAGYQFYEIGIGNLEDINNPVFRRYIKRVMRSHVGYGELEFRSRNGLFNAISGLRVNYYNKLEKFYPEPRLSITQKFADHFSIGLLAEMKSQSSTQIIDLQNDFLGVEQRRWILTDGNEIPLMQSKQVSLLLDYQVTGLLISLDTYLKEVNGLTSQSQGFQNQFQFLRTVGSYTSLGMDFLINYKYRMLNTWLTYSVSENQYRFREFTPSEFPSNLDIRHSIGFAASLTWDRFEVSSGIKWHTGRPFTPPVQGNEVVGDSINFDLPNSRNLDHYARLDLSAKYTIPLKEQKSFQFGISVWNILDRKNIVNQYYFLNDENQVELIQQASLGITPNLMMRFNF